MQFDVEGLDATLVNGPFSLQETRFPDSPGVYIVVCGDCIDHIGMSTNTCNRLGSLRRLGTHRGSHKVFCAAYVTHNEPLVYWIKCDTKERAEQLEAQFHARYTKGPYPTMKYDECNHGKKIMEDLIDAAGRNTWEAGYIQAAFTIGENLRLVLDERFEKVWDIVGRPPGPWPWPNLTKKEN